MTAAFARRGVALLLLLAACGEPRGQETQSLEDAVDTLAQEAAGNGAPDPGGFGAVGGVPDPDTAPPALIPDEDAAPEEWTTGIVSRPSTVAVASPLLVAVRTGRHEAFERVVFELGDEGAGMPAYHVSYVDKPLHACGSGEEIHPVGDGWLEVRMEPLDAHTPEGEATVPHQPRALPALHNLLRLYMTCDFEAVVTVVLAAQSPNEFRVFELRDPRRLVVDVRR